MSTEILLSIALIGILFLLIMIIKYKMQPFVALLIASLLVALATGIPAKEIWGVMTSGMGGVLGSVTIIVGLGAMLGKLIEVSGGAESLATAFTNKLGKKHTAAALTLATFILGIPVFFDVGFIIIAPIIYGFAKINKLSPLKYGLPIAGVMLTVHVALPPHPGPVSAAEYFKSDVGLMTMIGLVIAAIVGVVGYYVAQWMTRKEYAISEEIQEQMNSIAHVDTKNKNSPSAKLIAALIIIPIVMIMLGTVSSTILEKGSIVRDYFGLIGAPGVALLISLLLALYFLAIRQNWTYQHINNVLGSAMPTAAVVIMVTGAGGVFGKVLLESGVGKALSDALYAIELPIIPAAFIISLVLRASQGSATVAILTTGGLLAEASTGLTQMQLTLVTLATCFGGLGLSHVNDSGFWIVTKYLGLSVADGLKTWTILTTILGLTGFSLTWLLWAFV